MERTKDAENMPKPTDEDEICIFISNSLTKGTTVYNPQKPYTTEGIAAKSSIIFLNIFGITPLVKYSPKKRAAAIENGADIKSARKEVIMVPIKNGNIP